MPKQNYRDNEVDIRRQADEDHLYLNDRKIDAVKQDKAGRTIYKSEFAFGEFDTLEALGRAIIDTQSSLTNPTLDAVRKPPE